MVNAKNRLRALIDGGRYFDHKASRWVCPWEDDWEAAIAEADLIRAALDDALGDEHDNPLRRAQQLDRWAETGE